MPACSVRFAEIVDARRTDTLQSAVDGAFADALDEMAADLKALCTA